MYRGFRRSRIVMGVTLALTVALTVFVWMRNRGRAVYIPVLASVLLLGIGCTAARLLGNITASVACTGMLGILHMDLDPEAFLEQFLPVTRRIPGESRDGMVCRFYLSDSYFAAGRYAEAKSVLGELPARFYTALRKNLQESLSLLEARRDAAAGQPVDREQLEEQLNRAGYKLRSLELLQVLAMDARNRGDKAKCGAWLARMRQESGKTAFRKWAAEWNA